MNNLVAIISTTLMKWQIPQRIQITKQSPEVVETLTSAIMIKEIELIIKAFSQRKLQAKMTSLVISTKHFKEEIITTLQSLFLK